MVKEANQYARFPRYSDLQNIITLSWRIQAAEAELNAIMEPRTRSIRYFAKTSGTFENETEEKALLLTEHREELHRLQAAFCDLFKDLLRQIENGPGEDRLKLLIIFVFLYEKPLSKARKLAGWNTKKDGHADIQLNIYMDACKKQEGL